MKTLFITLSSNSVLRNILGYPKNVFEILSEETIRDNNFRVVVLVNKKDTDRYSSYLKNYLSDRYLIESVKINYNRNFWQKLFRFFCALIELNFADIVEICPLILERSNVILDFSPADKTAEL